MVVSASPSTVSLDHMYAKNETLLEEDLLSSSTDFLSTWCEGNIANSDDDDILSLLFGQEFTNFGHGSPPRSESTSSDSYMTPSPDALDDVELSEILSSTTGSPGVAHSTEDFTIDLGGWNVDIDLPDFEGTTDNSELTTITTACLPTSVTSATTCTVTVMPSRTATTTTTTTAGQPTVSLINRSKTLVLTSEELRLLELEGVTLPTDMPLTKAEEKVLKKVRRKIKNKQSAQESRRKKKDYVGGLEERVKACTELNHNLTKKVANLEKQNKSLLDQLKELQALVASTHPTKAQAGTCLMVLFLAFGLVLFPINNMNLGEQKDTVAKYAPAIVRSRTLLQVNEEYTAEPEDVSETTSFNVNNSDYLKAATPITLPGSVSHEVTVDVSEIDRTSQESKIKAHKR